MDHSDTSEVLQGNLQGSGYHCGLLFLFRAHLLCRGLGISRTSICPLFYIDLIACESAGCC